MVRRIWPIAVLMIIINLCLYFYSNSGLLKGSYFSSGILLSSNNTIYKLSMRTLGASNSIEYFEKIGNNSRIHINFNFLDFTFPSRTIFLSGGNQDANLYLKNNEIDRDIAFNLSYVSRKDSRLTFYSMLNYGDTKCFLLIELNKFRCYGK